MPSPTLRDDLATLEESILAPADAREVLRDLAKDFRSRVGEDCTRTERREWLALAAACDAGAVRKAV